MTATLIDASAPDAVRRAAAVLRQPGAVLLVPTETVYGLICRAADVAAAERIYRMKHRAASKKLGLFVGDWRKLPGVQMTGWPQILAEKYCPGPITLIVPAENGETVGFRVPDHPFLAELLKLCGEPLSQTSANLSGKPNVRSVAAALAELTEAPDLVIDGGEIPADALASTVVDATGETPHILRQGSLQVPEAVPR